MSHGDSVTELPPGFAREALTADGIVAAAGDDARGFYGLQFHPEVVHTEHGRAILRNFLFRICRAPADWDLGDFRKRAVERIRAQVGPDAGVVCGLSGGRGLRGGGLPPARSGGGPAHLRVRGQRTPAHRRGGRGSARARRGVRPAHPPRRRRRSFSRQARRRGGSRDQAQDHRRGVHPRLRGGGARPARRALPRPGNALPRRDRERLGGRPFRPHQVASQRGRASRAHGSRAGGAGARALQGRGARVGSPRWGSPRRWWVDIPSRDRGWPCASWGR